MVFGYSVISEGFTGQYRTAAWTILDENTHQATSVGYTAFYSPLTPSDGLRFSTDTELTLQTGPQVASYRPSRQERQTRLVDWTDGQHLKAGWVQSRIPAYFQFRTSQTRRERLTVQREGDRLVVVNGLGAAIRALHLADADGHVFTAVDIPAGAKATLTPAEPLAASAAGRPDMRTVYFACLSNITSVHGGTGRLKALDFLQPGTYLATLDNSPFVEPGLKGARPYQCLGVVYGIMKR
jgi:hypothetical protein